MTTNTKLSDGSAEIERSHIVDQFPDPGRAWDDDGLAVMLEGLARLQIASRLKHENLDDDQQETICPHYDTELVLKPDFNAITALEKQEDLEIPNGPLSDKTTSVERYRAEVNPDLALRRYPIAVSTVGDYVALRAEDQETDEQGNVTAFTFDVTSYRTKIN